MSWKRLQRPSTDLEMASMLGSHLRRLPPAISRAVRYSRLSLEFGGVWRILRQDTSGVLTFNTALRFWAGTRRRRWVNQTLALMYTRGIAPNLMTFTAVLSACQTSEDVFALRQTMAEATPPIQPDAMFYTAMLAAARKTGGDVSAVLADMAEQGVEVTTFAYSVLLREADTLDAVVGLLDEMDAKGCAATPASYDAAMSGLNNAGTRRVLRLMEWRGEERFLRDPGFICTLLRQSTFYCMRDVVLPLAAEIGTPLNAETLLACLHTCAKTAKKPGDDASEYAGLLVARARMDADIAAVPAVYESAMALYANTKDTDAANKLLSNTRDQRLMLTQPLLDSYRSIEGHIPISDADAFTPGNLLLL
eukprot:Rhum_TRINITY_DN17143_c0_g1::Rhum_TRINITY_DN17143_c0_g1_i1::g.165261::m.165261